MAKGNDFEWDIAKKLSLWLTKGRDNTQLVRSVLSGGNDRLTNEAANHVGDLAPNGPEGLHFRKIFAVECKCYRKDPDFWHVFSSEKWIVAEWWNKLKIEARPHGLIPLLIMKRNNFPIVVALPSTIDTPNCPRHLVIYPLGMQVIPFKALLDTNPDEFVIPRSVW